MTPPSREARPTPISEHGGGGAFGDMPEAIRPMLALSAPEPFDSPEYIFELMWGGVRAVAFVRDGVVRLRGRNGRDLAHFFPELQRVPESVKANRAILDGEIVAMDADGHPALETVRPRLQAVVTSLGVERQGEFRNMTGTVVETGGGSLPRLSRVPGHVTYQVFDLLWLDGRSLLEQPLWQRKNLLHDIATPSPEFAAVDFVPDEGVAFFDAVVERKLGGVVAKQKKSTYVPGRRTRSWMEIRALQSGDFVVGGYTFGGGRRKGEPFSQLLLGAYVEGRLEYAGSVSGGLTDVEARRLVALMEPLLTQTSPFVEAPQIPRFLYWTRPVLVCNVRFSEWSRDGTLRFPIFVTLRPDLDAMDCERAPLAGR